MRLKDRFERLRPVEEMEVRLVRALVADPSLLNPEEESILRHALSVSRLYRIHHGGADIGVGTLGDECRETVSARLGPLLLSPARPLTREALLPHLPALKALAL